MRNLLMVGCLALAACSEPIPAVDTYGEVERLRAELEELRQSQRETDAVLQTVELRVEEVADEHVQDQAEDASAIADIANDLVEVNRRLAY